MSTTRNHWAAYRNTLLQWRACVPIHFDEPGALVEWTKAIAILARDLGIAEFRPDQAAGWWSIDDVNAHLERRLAEESVVDAFGFSAGHLRTRSTVAFHAEHGIVERPVDDVGALLRELRAPVSEEHEGIFRSRAPLAIGGHAIDFRPDATQMAARTLPETSVAFELDTDLWLPWVRGQLDGERDELYDNRELAARHTPRLNRFLDEVRRMSLDRGGRWQFMNFPNTAELNAMADADGIRLIDTPPRTR